MVGEQWDVQAFRPVGARECRASPRVTALFHANQGVHRSLRHLRLLHDKEAAHVDDGADVLYADGTFFHACAAGQTVPQRFFLNPATYERLLGLLVFACDYAGRGFESVLFQVFHDVHRRENLAADVGGADVGAASADGARVAVQ